MEVRFVNRALERRYRQSNDAIRAWGPEVGRRYVMRIDLLIESPSFAELFKVASLRLHPLRGDRAGQYALTLHGRWRLVLQHLEDEGAILIEEVSAHYGD